MFLNAIKELTTKNPDYQQVLENYVWEAYRQDLYDGDITTRTFVSKRSRKVFAELKVKEAGVIAGMEESKWLLDRLGIRIRKAVKDGKETKSGAIIMKLEGSANEILMVERTLLNLIQRMSGVATSTAKMVKKIPKNIKLLATRKTLWGMMDKKSVAIGGGATHRLHLSDAALIKENHLILADDWKKGLKKVFKKSNKLRFVEIELETTREVEHFLKIYEDLKGKVKGKVVIMLDNFKPADIKQVVLKLKKAGVYVELSGGINERNIKNYCIKGVTAISSGSITTKAPNLDISLSIIK